jgi:hypothetical protein
VVPPMFPRLRQSVDFPIDGRLGRWNGPALHVTV